MKMRFIISILIMLVVMASSLMTGCSSEGAAAAPSDQSVQTESSQYDQQDETKATEPFDQGQVSPGSDASDIGMEKVKKIVLAKVPGAVESSIYELEKEYDDGRLEYEGSLYHDGYEYEFEIDGATGEILQWEIDD